MGIEVQGLAVNVLSIVLRVQINIFDILVQNKEAVK